MQFRKQVAQNIYTVDKNGYKPFKGYSYLDILIVWLYKQVVKLDTMLGDSSVTHVTWQVYGAL